VIWRACKAANCRSKHAKVQAYVGTIFFTFASIVRLSLISRQNPAMTQSFETPSAKILTGPQKALRKLGLNRPIDLALHLPMRYEDETRVVKLRDVREGDVAQIEGWVSHCDVRLGGVRQLLVTLDDGSGTCLLRFFTFYPSLQKNLAPGKSIRVRGEIKEGFAGMTMMHPVVKSATSELPKSLTPIYPSVAGLPQAYLRRAILGGLERADLDNAIPDEILNKNALQRLWPLREALLFLHYPVPDVALATLEDRSHPAWQRLKAEELLAQQISQLQSRRGRASRQAPMLAQAGVTRLALAQQLLKQLPFALTRAQTRVVDEIAQDLARCVPMHRLLQGDVGAGKTVVAALAATMCIDANRQCALMAPTEILATQHFAKLVSWLAPLGICTAWLTGKQKAKERREMLALIASGQAHLVVGTHALITENVTFRQLALVIIDEQHRFGVAQRLALRSKLQDGQEPHLLMMTATPIPRTLAMSYYADLDVSTIDELPAGRIPIVTKLIHESRRDEVVARIRVQIAQGRQIYWVCPLIEESEALDLTNATQIHEKLSAALPGVMVGLLHSRMPSVEKKAVMDLFFAGQMGVLVSTTVIEVGVDVPNASLMVIEHAERFGLSQLHQLRGRVGRGAAASACVLLYSSGDAPRLGQAARERLKAMLESGDGFEIARRDLEIRGPGEFMGSRQSGDAMLRFADVVEDIAWLDWARQLAPVLLDQYPLLAQQHVQRWLGGKAEFLKA
jgi:ATP-dependent DNA helicase RecG